jgi:hypothetical protein
MYVYISQDTRWGDSEKKLLEAMTKAGKFPKCFETKVFFHFFISATLLDSPSVPLFRIYLAKITCTASSDRNVLFLLIYGYLVLWKVDMSKVKVDVMAKWITERVVSILGFEDDIVINLAINMLNEPVSTIRNSVFYNRIHIANAYAHLLCVHSRLTRSACRWR